MLKFSFSGHSIFLWSFYLEDLQPIFGIFGGIHIPLYGGLFIAS